MGKKNWVMNSQKESVQGEELRKMLGKSPAEQ
jgi:predicted DNA-binding protein (MmcQ/YjbR family)